MQSSLVSLTFAAIVAAGSAAGCSNDAPPPAAAGTAAPSSGLPDRDPALAHKLVSEGAVLLDVRSPEEFASGHIDRAVNVPVDEIDQRMAEIDKLTGGDASKPIVVYCAMGSRAAAAKKMLVGAGHTKVTNLGAMSNWDKK